MANNTSNISGPKKAAIFLACMGSEKASRVLGKMSDEEVEYLTIRLSGLDAVDAETRTRVLEDFYEMAVANKVVMQGGLDYARGLLEKTFGAERTIDILTRLQDNLQDVPFSFLTKTHAAQVVSFIQDEHPQTIALVLAHLPAQSAAVVLSELPNDIQSGVVARIATMERTPPEVVREVERVLERRMSTVSAQGFTFAGGISEAAEILNNVDRTAEKSIMAELAARDPELAEEIARLMFTFDDLVAVEDAGIQKALRETTSNELALALKGANEAVKEKIFRNMSERARSLILEEMEFIGPVRLKFVEEAQVRFVAIIRRLEEAGELIIEGRGDGNEDEMVV